MHTHTLGSCITNNTFYVVSHSSILPLMALNGLYCADVQLSNYSLTHFMWLVLRMRSDNQRSPWNLWGVLE